MERDLNLGLRKAANSDDPKTVDWPLKHFSMALFDALYKCEAYGYTTYRALKMNKKDIESYRDAAQRKYEYIWPEFVSTTEDLSLAQKWIAKKECNVIIKIKTTLGFYGKKISQYSMYESEKEVLWQCNNMYRVERVYNETVANVGSYTAIDVSAVNPATFSYK